MNQTQKRLNIIKLAISIGDNETVQLQLLKLAPLKSDVKIQEIIRDLQAENYAKAQALITEYIETPPEEILQRTSQEEISPEDEEAIIEEFDLFRVHPEPTSSDTDLFTPEASSPNNDDESPVESDLDSLLSLTGDDILTDAPDIKQTISSYDEDDFFRLDERVPMPSDAEENDDDFFQTAQEVPLSSDEDKHEALNESFEKQETVSEAPRIPEPSQEEVVMIYEPIPYIDQKLRTMQTQYPPLKEPEGSYPAVDAWLIKISNEGYTEKEVEETIAYIQQLKEKGQIAEAAQLLLISAATQSKYAQFMLARALFKGDVLQQNLPEAFTLINRLAMDEDFPEAICDLGQMYENGIGIDKDKQRAEELYKEAMELGIKRAAGHYERVHRANKSFFGKLLGK